MTAGKLALAIRPEDARTTARGRAALAAAAAASMLLAGCASGDDEADVAGSAGATTGAAPTSGATPTSSARASSTLAGTWRAGPVSVEDMVATIRRYGLEEWIEGFQANAPFSEETVLVLTIGNDDWNLYGESGDGQSEGIDYDAAYQIFDDTVVFVHADGANTYRWEVNGDTLRLEFLKTTLPGYEGIPEEVFQRALYMSAEFTRQP